ncbi:MAG: aminoacetone oxidase family FAD-binding enzyme [Deltaproteobacteria bacterium]|nr:aminoacetone oxidase family FAD-binding enzyme [Deltaproteobacteria bacterium]
MTTEAPSIVTVGAGAAGLFAALAARGAIAEDGSSRAAATGAPHVLLVDGARRPGAKILVSGGGRCNVTNARVRPTDFACDAPPVLRALLASFGAEHVRRFFASRGVALVEETQGKLFPASGRARDVLAALTEAAAEAGVRTAFGARVTALERDPTAGFAVTCGDGVIRAARVIVATGGRSLPKSGSDGAGHGFAAALGLPLLPQVPALTPLALARGSALGGLAGLTFPVVLTIAAPGVSDEQVGGARFRPLARAAGSVLITHDGLSGPAALDVSGAAARVLAEGGDVEAIADAWALGGERGAAQGFVRGDKAPGACVPPDLAARPVSFEEFHADVTARAGERGLVNVLAEGVPRALAECAAQHAGFDGTRAAARLATGEWRKVFAAVARIRVPVVGTASYAKAEVTAGGVPLAALGRLGLEAKTVPGLHFCGEIVNVTGRLGGFNFQWAWSSGVAAGRAAAKPR